MSKVLGTLITLAGIGMEGLTYLVASEISPKFAGTDQSYVCLLPYIFYTAELGVIGAGIYLYNPKWLTSLRRESNYKSEPPRLSQPPK